MCVFILLRSLPKGVSLQSCFSGLLISNLLRFLRQGGLDCKMLPLSCSCLVCCVLLCNVLLASDL